MTDSSETQDSHTRNAERLKEVQEGLARLEQLRPSRNDPAAHYKSGKIPYKFEDYRAALIWRFTDLTSCAIEHFERERIAAAILLTRAAIEGAAAMWYVYKKIEAALEADQLGDLDDAAMRLLLGRKNNPDPDAPIAINVLTMIERFDKHMEEAGHGAVLKGFYDHLSEVAHPNWEGTLALYGKTNKEKVWTDFGHNIRTEVTRAHRDGGLAALSVAIAVFEHGHRGVGDLLPKLRALCERDLAAQKGA